MAHKTPMEAPTTPLAGAEPAAAEPPAERADGAAPARPESTAGVASGIALRGLRKTFGPDLVALEAVDLDIAAGEFFTLLGPSGCGKTTLLRILAGLEQADAGELNLGGQDVLATQAHRRSVNTVFQSYALFPHLDVRGNIGFGLRMRGVDKDEIRRRVDETAGFIKIGDLVDRPVDQLSGGQKQRVALARALINQPDVLLLDEPLAALDAGLRGELQVELAQTQQRLGMTFVFVTHDQQEAMVMSDRIAVLDAGRIQQVGTPEAIYERPANLFVARFMGHTNLFPVEHDGERGLSSPFGRIAGCEAGPGNHVLIRPETLQLRPADEDGDNRFPARVSERLYRGAFAEYRLECGPTTITAVVSNRGQQPWTVGDRATLVVDPGGLVCLGE